MPRFGNTSQERLDTCHEDIQSLFNYVVRNYDCTILEGHRSKEDQQEKFNSGKSKVKWPMSKHNKLPSRGVDVAPYPIDWGESGSQEERRKALARFYYFAGYVLAVSEMLGIRVRWGGDWDGDKIFSDQSFDDLVHWELLDD